MNNLDKSIQPVVTLAAIIFFMIVGAAFSPAAHAEDTPVRIVVLEIRGGGTELLVRELESLDNVELRDQEWFLGQVASRGFRAQGLMQRPDDLKWVMNGGHMDWLITLVANEEATKYEAHFIARETATSEKTVTLDMTEEGLSQAGASLLRVEAERLLGLNQPVAKVESEKEDATKEEEAVEADPDALVRRAAQERQEVADRLQQDWLWVKAHGKGFRKDLTIAGTDAVFAYASSFFPGFELDIEAFPFAMVDANYMSAGVYVAYNHGFDSLSIIEGEEKLAVSVQHIGIEGGAIYRLDTPVGRERARIGSQVRFKAGVRYEAFSVTENPIIPNTSLISLVAGARLAFPVLVDGFAVQTGLEFVPAAFYGAGEENFGTGSYTYGFSSDVGFLFEMTPGLAASVAYGFRLNRTKFEGEGNGDMGVFVKSDAFDLLQGLKVGVVYQH